MTSVPSGGDIVDGTGCVSGGWGNMGILSIPSALFCYIPKNCFKKLKPIEKKKS